MFDNFLLELNDEMDNSYIVEEGWLKDAATWTKDKLLTFAKGLRTKLSNLFRRFLAWAKKKMNDIKRALAGNKFFCNVLHLKKFKEAIKKPDDNPEECVDLETLSCKVNGKTYSASATEATGADKDSKIGNMASLMKETSDNSKVLDKMSKDLDELLKDEGGDPNEAKNMSRAEMDAKLNELLEDNGVDPNKCKISSGDDVKKDCDDILDKLIQETDECVKKMRDSNSELNDVIANLEKGYAERQKMYADARERIESGKEELKKDAEYIKKAFTPVPEKDPVKISEKEPEKKPNRFMKTLRLVYSIILIGLIVGILYKIIVH